MKDDKPIIISIVEDELIIGRSLKDYINSKTDHVCNIHFTNGEESIRGIISTQPDIVIMDIGLPVKNGVECMKEILDKNDKIKFIMFTVFDTDELLFDALKNGASGYILKDDTYDDIVAAVDEVLAGGGPMSPAVASKVIKSFKRVEQIRKMELLTEHQTKILGLVSDGLLNKEIADKLSVKEGTIKNQIRTIYNKLQVNNRVEASLLYKG